MTGDEKEVLNPGDVIRMLGMSKSSFYDFLKVDPNFPKPILLGKVKKYLREEVEWYLRHRPREEHPRKTDSAGR